VDNFQSSLLKIGFSALKNVDNYVDNFWVIHITTLKKVIHTQNTKSFLDFHA